MENRLVLRWAYNIPDNYVITAVVSWAIAAPDSAVLWTEIFFEVHATHAEIINASDVKSACVVFVCIY